MIFLSFFVNIGFAIEQAIRTLTGKLAGVLYNFIVYLYNVFMYISRAEVLDNTYINAIYNRVGMILGLFMIFKLSFSLVQSLVDPNRFDDEKKGYIAIIRRVIISIVMLGVVPTIFRAALNFQGIIVGTANDSNNVIYRLVVADNKIESASSFGRTIAAELYFGFFRESTGSSLSGGFNSISDPESDVILVAIEDYETIKTQVRMGKENGGKDFDDLVYYLSLRGTDGSYAVEWDEIFVIVVAIIMIYILVNYCVSVATRVIQLAYLQLIAPIPILSYISDPDGTFKKWLNQCIATYLDLFLRLAIIYFIIALSKNILDFDNGTILASTGLNKDSSEFRWVVRFLIIGLLMFGKRVPELLKELFPGIGTSASFDLGIKSMKNLAGGVPIVGGLAAGAIGYGVGKAKALGMMPINGLKKGASAVGNKLGNGAKALGGLATKPVRSLWNKTVTTPWRRHVTEPLHQHRENVQQSREARDTLWKENRLADAGEVLFHKAGGTGNDPVTTDMIADSFENTEYASSYRNVQNKKAAMDIAKEHGNTAEYMAAKDAYDKAKTKHETLQQAYYKDALKEKQWDAFKRRRDASSGGTTTSRSPSPSPSSGTTTSRSTPTPPNASTTSRSPSPSPSSGTTTSGPSSSQNYSDRLQELQTRFYNLDPSSPDYMDEARKISREIDEAKNLSKDARTYDNDNPFGE